MTPDEIEVVKCHLPFVEKIARAMAMRLPTSISVDDLIQWGAEGLLDAIKRFDPNRKNKFKTYAEYRIRGAMLDGLRKEDALGRSARDLQKAIRRETELIRIKFGRPARDEEIAEKLGLSSVEFDAAKKKIEPITHLPIQYPELFTRQDRKALMVSTQNLGWDLDEKVAAMEKLEMIVAGHNPIDRACVILYNVWGLDLKEIAEVFGCSESRISQRLARVRVEFYDHEAAA